ncbi:cysteine-rich CWC family protein [Vibrio sp. WXL103]|uniref:cysteine-rich CWC family protein n=1 Tax=unclassified Vibrio TaxID=2614977 RepID=UPI003EC68E17
MKPQDQATKCPICQQDNRCGQPKTQGCGDQCWCFDQNIKFPEALLDQVPQDQKGIACICQSCAEKFAKSVD